MGNVMDPTSNILLVAARETRHGEVRSALVNAGLAVQSCSFHSPEQPDLTRFSLALVDSADAVEDAAAFAQKWFAAKDQRSRPLVWIAEAADMKARRVGWEAGATVCLTRPFLPADLQAQVEALLQLEEE